MTDRLQHNQNSQNNGGYILVGVLFMMLLLSITAVAVNREAGLQARMAVNQKEGVQTTLYEMAAIEASVWELTSDPFWRTAAGGETVNLDGVPFTRKVLDTTVAGYTDAVTVSVIPQGTTNALSASYRYTIHSMTPLLAIQPHEVCIDNLGFVYIADPLNHSIWKLDSTTGAMTRAAGNGTSGFSGDGGLATACQLNGATGVAMGPLGNFYIADTNNHRIRKVSLAGNITTVAGNGSDGYSGDGGLATNAELKKPTSLSIDVFGNIYIADNESHCIRKVDFVTGIITTVAGICGSHGWSPTGGAATSRKLNKPTGVFVDATGDIYIADTDSCRIRRVDHSDGNLYTMAGDGFCSYAGDGGNALAAQLNRPNRIYVDGAGNIFIADQANHRIRRVDGATGIIDTVAGSATAGYSGDGGQAVNAELDSPKGICLNAAGEMAIADTTNSCIRWVDLGGKIETLSSTGLASFDHPRQLAMDGAGNVYIADTDNERVRMFDTAGIITTVAGTGSGGYDGDGIPATNAKLHKPRGVCVAPSGNFYIADRDNHRIRKVDTATGIITTYAGTGAAGDNGTIGPPTATELNHPSGVAVSQFFLEIADTDNHRVLEIDGLYDIYPLAGTGASGYSGDGGLGWNAELNKPHGVFLDAALNVYIADTENHCIRRVDGTTFIITTVAGIPENSGYSGDGGPATNALLNKPEDVYVDGAGNIFISDTENDCIRVVSARDGTIHTLAGTAANGYNGDDQPAVTAELNKPAGIVMPAIRGGRKIFISDRDNDRLRVLSLELVKEL